MRDDTVDERRCDELIDDDGAGAVTEVLAATRQTLPVTVGAGGPVLGDCLADRHSTLHGRVRVRWASAGQVQTRWVPTLVGLAVRAQDRVLLVHAENATEPVVVGVVDGFARRPVVDPKAGATIALAADEAVRVVAADGARVVEIRQSASGPVVRLFDDDVDVELPGALRLRAAAIRLQADAGSVEVEASDDVVVKGETIDLN